MPTIATAFILLMPALAVFFFTPTGQWLITNERRLAREPVAWLVVITLLNLADFATTAVGLGFGSSEANPLVIAFGWGFPTILKMIGVPLFILAISGRKYLIGYRVCAFVLMLAVIHNLSGLLYLFNAQLLGW
jgi:hypothetical protein